MNTRRVQPHDRTELLARLRDGFRPGDLLAGDATLTELRGVGDEAVCLFRWAKDPHLFGVPISLTDLSKSYFYELPVASTDEWLDELGTGLMVQLDTGFVARATRARVDDYIELREPSWPVDERFSHQVVHTHDPYAWNLVTAVVASGLDPQPALNERDAGRLVAWLVAYENNSTGRPVVGSATISQVDDSSAALTHLEVAPGVPSSVVADLARFAVYEAACSGASSVVTDVPHAELDLLGFRRLADGSRQVSTDLLDADAAAAAALVAQTRDTGWGRDRDLAGRHLPSGRVRRLLHRLRHGRSGAKPVTYVGVSHADEPD